MRLILALSMLVWTAIACSAAEAIHYPVAIPGGCFPLAQREGYPTLIESRWEGLKERAKLARMKNSDPLVLQCKNAVAQAVAEYKTSKE